MQAFLKYGERPFEAGLRDVTLREPNPEEVLVRVAGCGICGSDLHAFRASSGYEWVNPPVILGHEFAGQVEFVPAGVDDVKPGDPVVVIGIQGCGGCRFCRSGDTHLCMGRKVIGLDFDGGMAAKAWVNRRHLILLPESIDLVKAAMLEPISVAVHALAQVDVRPGMKIVVSGPGPIGLLCASLAAKGGAAVLLCGTSADEDLRLPTARSLGLMVASIGEAPYPALIEECFGSESAPDLWIEASGSVEAFRAAIGLLRRGGTFLAVGMYDRDFPFFASAAVRAELQLQFSYASAYRDYATALDLLQQGALPLDALAQPVPMARADEVFRAAVAGRMLKPILIP